MARWHSCNILQVAPDSRELWQFTVSGENLKAVQHETKLATEPLSAKLVSKDWQTLYQKKLNVACLPPEKVFLRVLQIPAQDFAEAQSMLDLQMEKISPMPVQQIVWTFELLRGPLNLRTAIVVIVARDFVEEFLGKLETGGYLADRLEVPLLDQLLATKVQTSGAWVYPGLGPDKQSCLVAWWYDGVLQNLTMIHVPPEPEAGRYLRQQLAQMAWAGEVEGWLNVAPKWHLVAGPELAVTWEPWLREEGAAVELAAPSTPGEVAQRTARRATGSDVRLNLLPAEFAARYRQMFIDRIWMRSLGAVIVLVLIGTIAYLAALQFVKYQVAKVETDFRSRGASYTNAIKIKAEVQMMQDQVDLQFAALECWKAVATALPEELTLQSVNFQRGKTLTISGSGPAEAGPRVADYNEALRAMTFKDEPVFSKIAAPDLRITPGQGLRWTLTAELKRTATE